MDYLQLNPTEAVVTISMQFSTSGPSSCIGNKYLLRVDNTETPPGTQFIVTLSPPQNGYNLAYNLTFLRQDLNSSAPYDPTNGIRYTCDTNSILRVQIPLETNRSDLTSETAPGYAHHVS